MKVTEHIAQAKGKTLFSFEIVPPKKGNNIEELYKNIEPLLEFKPPFIDVTTSREEYLYKEHPNGLLEKKLIRMRPGTVGICSAIQHKYNIDTVPHVLCGGFTKEETEDLLVDCFYLGIDNIMALRGDAMKEEKYFRPTKNGNVYALDLVKQINNLRKGIYLHDTLETNIGMDFCIGVAGYPEKHIEAPSKTFDLEKLKEKVDNGADYVVTQMFFDNKKYFEFVDKAHEMGIHVPIIPGIKPITVKKHLNILPQAFFLDFPEELVKEIEKCKNNEAVKQVGIEWAIAQSIELKKAGVPSLHYYSMGKSENIIQIISQVF